MNTNKPVILYRSEVPSTKGRQFVASALLAVSLGVISLQAGFVIKASAEGNPITSAITSAENPVTAPEVNPTPAPSNNNSDNGNNSGGHNGVGSSNNSGGSSSTSCNNEAPKAPRVISAVTTGKNERSSSANEITLNWEKPVSGNVSHYSVSYGLLKGKALYGVANVGNVTSFKVSGLAGGVTYFFTVKAVNHCTPSVASNEVAIKVGGKFINTPAVGFSSNAVLGKTNQTVKFNNNSASKPAISKPVVFNNGVIENEQSSSSNKPANAGLAGKVVSFFKGLFN